MEAALETKDTRKKIRNSLKKPAVQQKNKTFPELKNTSEYKSSDIYINRVSLCQLSPHTVWLSTWPLEIKCWCTRKCQLSSWTKWPVVSRGYSLGKFWFFLSHKISTVSQPRNCSVGLGTNVTNLAFLSSNFALLVPQVTIMTQTEH